MIEPWKEDAYKAVARLHHNDDFKIFMKYLQRKLDICRKENDRQTAVILQWNQGKCQALQEILNLPEMARQILKTF